MKAPEDRGLIPGLVPLLADSQRPVTEGCLPQVALPRWRAVGPARPHLAVPLVCTAGSPEGL